MKKVSFALNVLLVIVAVVLLIELKAARAQVAQWELYVPLAMGQLWALAQDEAALQVPSRKLPEEPTKRLLALAEGAVRRVDRCMVIKAQLEAKLGGYYNPVKPDGD
jgi:hypothetical protein